MRAACSAMRAVCSAMRAVCSAMVPRESRATRNYFDASSTPPSTPSAHCANGTSMPSLTQPRSSIGNRRIEPSWRPTKRMSSTKGE
jgi:hypothetical protein